MPKKLTYEYVKSYIESFDGYKLLSEDYENSYTKLKVKCPRGHIFWTKFNVFKNGKRCRTCHFEDKRNNYEDIRFYIESKGYKLLSKEYINNSTKLKMQCPKEHLFEMSWSSFHSGQRCAECFYEKRRMDFDYVKSYIESKGYKLLSNNYKNNQSKLKLQCPNNHIFWTCWSYFFGGSRCLECSYEKLRTDFHYMKSYIEQYDYKLLSREFVNNRNRIKLKCPKGHIFWTNFYLFKKGYRCQKCNFENRKIPNQEIIDKLSFCENIRENENKEVEVTCTYCGEWFVPDRSYLIRRTHYVNSEENHEYRLYCSENCKDNCPIFRRRLYPKGYAPATSREVQPQLRQLVFERDNYTCQRCGWYKDDLDVGLHCHHKYPLNEDPIQSADIDTCITYCEDCHKWVHQNVAGCGYGEMRC